MTLLSRLPVALALAAWTACAAPVDPWDAIDESEALGFLPGDFVPPPGSLEVAVTPIVPGQPATWTITGGYPGDTVYLLRSPNSVGQGPCHRVLGACLTIRAPFARQATLTLDSNGEASVTLQVPAHITPGRSFAFQAFSPTSVLLSAPKLVVVDPADGLAAHIQVVDADGRPLPGAAVTVDGTSVLAGDDGVAHFSGLAPGEVVIRTEVDNYAPSVERVELVPGSANTWSLHLKRYEYRGVFPVASPGSVYFGEGYVDLQADAFVNGAGDPVTGFVEIRAYTIDLYDLNGVVAAPGDFTGLLDNGETVDFESLGMAEISFFAGGEEVFLAPGQTALLNFYPPNTDGLNHGDVIPAWSFNEETGVWEEDGFFVYDSNFGVLTAEVTHFTWWNCDKPWYDKNCLDVQVTLAGSGAPVAGATVLAQGVDYFGTSYGYTDATGHACVDYKLGATVTVNAQHPLFGASSSSVNITGDTVAATCAGQGAGVCQAAALELPEASCASGVVVDSGGAPVEGALVFAELNSSLATTVSAMTDATGTFCLQLPADTSTPVSVYTNDGRTGQALAQTGAAAAGTCGATDCFDLGDIEVSDELGGCVSGVAYDQDYNGGYGGGYGGPDTGNDSGQTETFLPEGTPIHVFLSSAPVSVSCEPGTDDPASWGFKIGEGTVGPDGAFCVEGLDLGVPYYYNNGGVLAYYYERGYVLVFGDCSTIDPNYNCLPEAWAYPQALGTCADDTCYQLGNVYGSCRDGGGEF
jgi:hypothetical protein